MKYAAFCAASERAFEDIPEQYKDGIEGLVVSREAVRSPHHADVYTMGECVTESWSRSSVVLYWGSFREMAREDPQFDWEGEIWETLTHELRHHLESLASEDQLEDVDYAMDEGLKRDEGVAFDPWYYQKGDEERAGVFRVEGHAFIEQTWSADAFAALPEISFERAGRRWTIPRPAKLGDVHFILIRGAAEADETLELVLLRRRSLWQSITRLFGGPRPEVLESEAEAKPAPPRS